MGLMSLMSKFVGKVNTILKIIMWTSVQLIIVSDFNVDEIFLLKQIMLLWSDRRFSGQEYITSLAFIVYTVAIV